uniref:Predicted ATP-binding protein involved in virulence n=2 Tax=Candidatus Kentrum sp. TUN TaxID=2126343 RepID=A0A450ZNZ6_9GAMM|nr:MAG: Predicted ATP-binding protein involved in virulence [Candidatus Kentron sp. TUN]VFK61473.1 MAG: Predicted ATP-binding protein involved in virulence [Candidatus Kentron sp. TUN]
MRIHEILLNRFRGIHSLSLELDDRLNVFVGENGAGKSTVLDAAAILLSWLVNRVKSARGSGRPITEPDIHNAEHSASLSVTLNEDDRAMSWRVAKARKGHRDGTAVSALTGASEAAQRLSAAISEGNGRANLPLFAYYPVNRAVLDIPLRIRARHRFDLLSAYDESLIGGANFRTFFEWFREREDLENEARRDYQSPLLVESIDASSGFPDPQLEAVRNALTRLMPEFKNLTVRRNPLRMEVEKEGKRLLVNQLSDGEMCLMAMAGDIARRMAIANPSRDNPLGGDGVILIDEIDLHLHPLWQRMVIPRFTEVFPNIQFLISTHSPHVITHVRPNNLFLLRMGSDGLTSARASESYGKTAERVLEDLMGLETTRPEEVKVALKRIYGQIDEGDLDGARKSIAELGHEIGDDPELIKANVLIRRKELIGK